MPGQGSRCKNMAPDVFSLSKKSPDASSKNKYTWRFFIHF
jgi:hypothetical protein